MKSAQLRHKDFQLFKIKNEYQDDEIMIFFVNINIYIKFAMINIEASNMN